MVDVAHKLHKATKASKHTTAPAACSLIEKKASGSQGTDFLAQHGMLGDVGCKCLLDTRTCCSRSLSAGPGMPAVCAATSSKYSALRHEFPDVFKLELRQVPGTHIKHGIYHHITTTGPPKHAKFRRLLPKKLQDVKQAFAEIDRMGICKKASSPWASPLHMVKKPDGSWRPCGDYCRLNMVPVYPNDILKTAIITPFGTYTFSYSTVGLRNARATFQ
ncbi:uncharacterized protein LOC135211368 [Macrobrachium nipponense]|uniref:uncharacterized protein LOC135211368 n=1 Tax=Macrobrachium nipponense TaxID=159736 RepID=UPI0030C88B9D